MTPPSDLHPAAALPASARRGMWWPVRLVAWLLVAVVLSGVAIAPLDTWSQTLFASFTFGFCLLLGLWKGRWVTLTLIIVSITVSSRYLYWRVTATVGNEDGLDMVLGLILLFAESYAVLVLVLGYVQTAWPLERKPVALPEDTSLWPTVDIYIPTYNEPLSVVRTTILAAKALDWPADKLKVYVLDDGRREEFRAFAATAGVGYIIRPDNKHAKAGNINHALKKTRGDLIAIFDCDHIPTRSFLQLTVGWFLRDKKLALVQTPHHFYTPDPFERNLGNFKKVPNEGELFYGVIQKGNDLWNATFFCGSCAVIRRAPLEEVGGIAPETVTEDAHTMLKLHRRGYSSAYIDLPQAAGLATESLSGHVGQRIRWARGMAQIFRVDNPIIKRGLGLVQRLCYASAMLHFFYGIPRLIFLIAPLAYLGFGAQIFNASAETILAFALPHMAHAYLTNSRIQGRHRHSFWAEVYEATLATYIIYPTTLALISPKLGKFNVTAKGGVVERDYFDLRIAAPYLVLLALNLFGITMGLWRWFQPGAEHSAIAVNLAWSAYGLLFLTATLAVAWERQQRRVFPRVDARLPATIRLPDQKVVTCETVNLSTSGLALITTTELPITKDDIIDVTVLIGRDEVPAEARVVQKHGRSLRVEFISMPLAAEESLVRATFSRPTAWTDWARGRRPDHPLVSLLTVFWHGLRGAARIPQIFSQLLTTRRAGLLLLAFALGFGPDRARAQAEPEPEPTPESEPAPAPTPESEPAPEPDVEAPPTLELAPIAGTMELLPRTTWSFEHIGFARAARKYNRRTSVRLPFSARGDEVFTRARLTMDFDLAAPRPRGVRALVVKINDEPLGRVPFDDTTPLTPKVELDVAPQLLGERNALSLELELDDHARCPVLVELGAWEFLQGGQIEATAAPLPLPDQLDMLPLPFLDPHADSITTVHIVLPPRPDPQTLRAASHLAAYFGVRGGGRFEFAVHTTLPTEDHAIVLITAANAALVPGLPTLAGPTVAMRPNPRADARQRKLLVVAGRTSNELELAARRLLVDFEATRNKGADATFDFAPALDPRVPYDAPRWFPTGGPLSLGQLAEADIRTFRGALGGSITVPFRIPPDVFTWPTPYLELDLAWRSLVPPGVDRPELVLELNGHYLGRLDLDSDPDQAAHQTRTIRVPTTALRGFNELHAHVVPPASACPDPKAELVEVELLADSILHLEGHERFRPMPDLDTFVDDGFPFTVMADLSQTVVVLPPNPLPEELGAALSFVAHVTAITGHPPLGLTFSLAASPDPAALAHKDLVIIGAAGRLSGYAAWEKHMPIRGLTTPSAATSSIQLPSIPWTHEALAFLQGEPLTEDLTRLSRALKPGPSRAFAVGFESPITPGRSVVLLSADSAEALPSLPALKGFSDALRRQADVIVLTEDRRASFRVLPGYEHGSLPPFLRFLWFISSHWVVLLPTLFIAAMLFATIMRRRLMNVAYRRLTHEDRA